MQKSRRSKILRDFLILAAQAMRLFVGAALMAARDSRGFGGTCPGAYEMRPYT